jgi:hypothetical protein
MCKTKIMEKEKRKVSFFFGGRGFFMKSFKTIIISFVLLAFSGILGSSLKAQDIIILKSGEEIKSTVSEVSSDLIKYKKFENLSGPVYSVEKSKVFMIKYQNGTKDVFNEQTETKPQTSAQTVQKPLSVPVSSSSPQALTCRAGSVKLNGKALAANEVKRLYGPYPNALHSYNSGRTLNTVGDVVGYVGLAGGLIAMLNSTRFKYGSPERYNASVVGLAILLPTLVTDIVLVSVGRGKIRSSVNQYNSAINKPVTYRLDFGINQNGVGIALKF